MSGGSRVSGFHHPVIEVRLVDDLSRMSHELPDPTEDHRLFRVVFPNFFALLTQLLSHGRHMCRQLSIFHLQLLELLPIRSLLQIPKDISDSAVVQGPVCSPCDVLQLVILGLKILQLIVDSFEGIVRKIPGGMVHVLPSGILIGSGFRLPGEGEVGEEKLASGNSE